VLGLVLLLVPLAVLVGVVFSLVNGFTTFFVVPVMLLEGGGVLASWRRFFRTLRSEWREYLVFAVLTFVLTLILGTAVGFVVGIIALLVFGPLALFGLAGVVTAGALGPGGGVASLPVLAALGVVGLLALLLVLFVASLVRVPVVTYLRYYALLVLGDTDADLDLVPERRRTIRAGSGADSTAGGSGPESA
jgi:preprotein translocase subunit Sss1